MTTFNQEIADLSDAVQKKLGLKNFRAVLGDEAGRVFEPGRIGYVRVRYITASGFSSYVVARFRVSINPIVGTEVLVGYDEEGELAVLKLGFSGLIAQGTDPTSSNPADPNNSFWIAQYRLLTAASHPVSSSSVSMLVTVHEWLVILDGTVYYFAGDQIDLTSFIPGSSNEWCIACIFWKTDNTLETFASTPKSSPDDLGIDDVQECMDARSVGSLPIWAWRLFNGQTGISPGAVQVGGDDFLDLRQFINVVDSSNGGTSLVVTDGTTTVDPTSTLSFNPAYFDVTDGGGGEADVAIKEPLTLTSPVINTGISGTAIIDDATFASPSSTKVPTTNAVKGYVDQTILGLNAKADVRLATAAALAANTYNNGASGVGATLTGVATGVLTVDGVTVALNDRILVKNEVANANNGIYKCTVAGAIGVAYVLTRTTDGDTDAELRGGWMFSTEGTANAGQGWLNTNTSAITFGSTSITFGEFSAGAIMAGTGLTKTGNTIALDTPVALANGGTHADLSATGGTGQFLKQSSAGGDVSVGAIADADVPDALTISGGTINNTPIGATTASTIIATALSILIGGFKAIFTHTNSADRTYTFPNQTGGVPVINDVGLRPLCLMVSTSNVDITNAPATIDGQSPSVGARVLLVGQSTASQNGPWVSGGVGAAMSRPDDYPSGNTLYANTGMIYYVRNGNANAGTFWRLGTSTAITIDTTSTSWSMLGLTGAALAVVLSNFRGDFSHANTANRIYTFQDSSDTIVGRATTDTLTNKTLDGGTVFNEPGADVDIRIESDTDANNFFSDGGNNNVGFGTGTPDASAKIHVVSTAKGSIPAPVMTGTQRDAISSPATGLQTFTSDTYQLSQYDSVRYKSVNMVGFLPYALPFGLTTDSNPVTANVIAANGGSYAVPVMLSAHMLLESVSVRCGNTSLAHTWGWDIYLDDLDNNNTIRRVANSNADETFTPVAATTRNIVAATDPTYLAPGCYWLVFQNRHASNTFNVISWTPPLATAIFTDWAQTKTTTSPNGASLDFVAATWTKTNLIPAMKLHGQVFGQSTGF